MRKIRLFLTRDVKEHTETRMSAIMVRFFSLIWGLYWIGIGVLLAVYGDWQTALFCIVPFILYMLVFYLTYCGKTIFASALSQLGTILFAFVGWWQMNGTISFSLILWGVLLLVFFASHERPYIKVLKAIALLTLEGTLLTVGRFVLQENLNNQVMDHISVLWTITILFAECVVLFLGYSQSGLDQEKELIDKNIRILQMASIDPLTKVFNRRAVDEHLQNLEKTHEVSENGYSIAIGDIDFFKKVNDVYGHDAGDAVLKELASRFVNFMRSRGIVARWGGEEFLFIFENANGDQAWDALESLREQIEKEPVYYQEQEIKMTMTFGVEEYAGGAFADTIKKADMKLYRGKQNGRNKVIF